MSENSVISDTITCPNGAFGYTLPERMLGNYELQAFLKLAGIDYRYAHWHTRHDHSNPLLVRPDWCWQNYTVGYEYNVSGGQRFINRFCDYLGLPESAVFISCSYGRSAIQFTLTEEAERQILRVIEREI
jgi:hypothetical protein